MPPVKEDRSSTHERRSVLATVLALLVAAPGVLAGILAGYLAFLNSTIPNAGFPYSIGFLLGWAAVCFACAWGASRRKKWVTRLGVHLTVISALALAVLIPNLPQAIERIREREALRAIRDVATAVEAYSRDHDSYPVADSMLDLVRVLQPTYTKALPLKDGWNNLLEYTAPADGSKYRIRSRMADGKWDAPVDGYVEGGNACGDWDRDVVFDTGSFIRWPEGGCYGD